MKYQQITDKLESFIAECFNSASTSGLYFHSFQHTQKLVKHAGKIAAHYELNKEDVFVLEVACWVSDAGYTKDPSACQTASAGIATEFLNKNGAATLADRVTALITYAENPEKPTTLLEEIFSDAKHFYYGQEDFAKKNELLKKEMEGIQGMKISKMQWKEETVRSLETYRYFTDYCRTKLDAIKKENLRKLVALENEEETHPAGEHIDEIKAAEKFLKKSSRPEKGVETMFRITSSNNQHLSVLADNKAHILITVNSIILSAVISLALRKLEVNYFLAFPTFALLAVSVVSLVIAILATRPSVPNGRFNIDEISQKKVNLLFFGNYFKMSLEEYTNGMLMVMDDFDELYNMLIMDVYFQGRVLGKKYRLLKMAYNVFMYGLIISVIAFIAVTLVNHDIAPPKLPVIK